MPLIVDENTALYNTRVFLTVVLLWALVFGVFFPQVAGVRMLRQPSTYHTIRNVSTYYHSYETSEIRLSRRVAQGMLKHLSRMPEQDMLEQEFGRDGKKTFYFWLSLAYGLPQKQYWKSMFIICKGVTGVSLCRKNIESSLPLMAMCQDLAIFKAIISSTYTTKHKKCAYFTRCGKKGI